MKHPLNQNVIISAYNEWNKFGILLGMQFEVIASGDVLYTMTIHENHLATPITAHGGCIASLMDAALGVCALSCACEKMNVCSTVTMNMNFLSPAKVGDVLSARAKKVKEGKRLIFVSCEISNQRNELVASGTATMNVYPAQKLME